MRSFIRLIKLVTGIIALAAMLVGTSAPSEAGTGKVRLRVAKAGFIIGVGGGSGTLTYLGKTYPLSVGGVGLGTIGVAEAKMTGRAYNLRSPSDIVGTYQAESASVAVIGGPKVARLQNAKGVVLELRGVELGLEATLGLGGMTIEIR